MMRPYHYIFILSFVFITNRALAQRDVRPSGRQSNAPAPTVPLAGPTNEEIDEQLRNLTGRVESVENQISRNRSMDDGDKESVKKDRQALDQKFLAYEEALKKLESEVQALTEEIAHLKADKEKEKPEKGSKNAKGKAAEKSSRASYDDGEGLLTQKKYKEAILSYQKYRDTYPKGKLYADATYKMGVCFQELGLKDEAKVFFDEVTSKFAGSKEAKKAAFRAKQLK